MSNKTKRAASKAAEEILGGYFPVLDHGFVSLVDYMGTDDAVERAARVSFGYGTRKVSKTRGLIRYLMRHLHTTPTEMVEFLFHCSMPIFVARQWVRHRTASINEYSGRYSIMPMAFYSPEPENFALQSTTNHQGREGSMDRSLYEEASRRWRKQHGLAEEHYGWMIGEGVARELSRIDLPLSTYTQWYWKIDLHNLLHFLTLRVDARGQMEIRAFAQVIAGMVQRVAPLSFEAWLDYRVMGGRLSAGEIAALARLLSADDEGVSANGNRLSNSELADLGLSPREVAELKEKLVERPRPDLSLDIRRMRSAEYFRRRTEEALPVIRETQGG